MMQKTQVSPYRDFNAYLQYRFGYPLYRVPIDPGFGCPHLEDGGEGCIFCDENLSKAEHVNQRMKLEQQVAKGIQALERHHKPKHPMLYLQAGSGTNAPVKQLDEVLSRCFNAHDFKAVLIGTRPDCLPREMCEYLGHLNKKTPVIIELGVQTANDQTLRRIHRGHTFDDTRNAVNRLHAHGIMTAAHVILGMPQEDLSDWYQTAYKLAALPFGALKLHHLQVLKNTDLAVEWQQERVRTLDEFEYAEGVIGFLRRIPLDWVVMRLLAEYGSDRVLAPKWQLDKGQFINHIRTQMQQRGVTQGDLNKKGGVTEPPLNYNPQHVKLSKQSTYQKQRAETLAHLSLSRNPSFNRLLSLGYGAGFTALPLFVALSKQKRTTPVQLITTPLRPKDLCTPCCAVEWLAPHCNLLQNKLVANSQTTLQLKSFSEVENSKLFFDIIILEPCFTDKYPELTEQTFIASVFNLLTDDGVLITPLVQTTFRRQLDQLNLTYFPAKPGSVLHRGGLIVQRAGLA